MEAGQGRADCRAVRGQPFWASVPVCKVRIKYFPLGGLWRVLRPSTLGSRLSVWPTADSDDRWGVHLYAVPVSADFVHNLL